jgi:uncharacterized membrane protein YdbT with pleckstrin-like domain
MSYVDNNLMSSENVVYTGKIHWFVFAPGAFVVLLAFVFLGMDKETGVGPVLGLLFSIFGFAALIKAAIYKMTTELAVTSKRVIAKTGFISRNTVELNHQKVESFNVDQSIMGRILGFGTLVVNGTGGGKTPIANIVAPLVFRRQAMEIIDAN